MDVMRAVRLAVTDVLMLHEAEAHVEVLVRVQPMALRHARSIAVEVADDEVEDDDIEGDQLKAAQEARFRGLELR
jgi:hypothetical protein